MRRIVDTARDVAGSRYAALEVIGADGLLGQFLQVGMDEEEVRPIGELPKGGVLRVLIEDPKPIRLTGIAPNSQHAGHDRRSDAYHPKDLHPKVFLNETPFQPLRTQMDLVVFNRLDVLGCDA